MRLINLLKTENIIKVNSEETLSTTLKKLNSSHDAAFVFEGDKFLGLINPYYTLITHSYPSNTKVKNCLYYPPKIKINFSINKVIDFFRQTKVHYLPVFNEKDKFIGIISARRVLAYFLNHPLLKQKIKELLIAKKQTLITIFNDETINHAFNLFKKNKISKIVVIDKNFKLFGILSYYDLIDYLTLPKQKETKGERIGNKLNFYYFPIKSLVKRYVLTLTEDNLIKDAVNLILEKKIGSVVIIDRNKNPVNIVTTKDIFNFLFKAPELKKIEIIAKDLSKENRQILGGFFDRFRNNLQKKSNIQGAKLIVKEKKNGGLFETILSLSFHRGKTEIRKQEGKNFIQLMKKILKG